MNLQKMLKSLKNDDGFTFKKAIPIRYKTGWQVGIFGIEVKTVKSAVKIVKEYQNCGVWLSDGTYYIDSCKHIKTKKEAIELAKNNNQQSIYNWRNGKLTWC